MDHKLRTTFIIFISLFLFNGTIFFLIPTNFKPYQTGLGQSIYHTLVSNYWEKDNFYENNQLRSLIIYDHVDLLDGIDDLDINEIQVYFEVGNEDILNELYTLDVDEITLYNLSNEMITVDLARFHEGTTIIINDESQFIILNKVSD